MKLTIMRLLTRFVATIGLQFSKRQLHNMSNDQLEYLLSADDNFAMDCLLESLPSVTKLQRQRDELRKQNADLAKFNYAREPEFVKDRLKLRQVLDDTATLKRRLMCKQLTPILEKLDICHANLLATTCQLEEQCERMASDFLEGRKSFDMFKAAYLQLRSSASRKRILADKLGQERARLLANLPKPAATGSPVPAPRQRKRVSFNR